MTENNNVDNNIKVYIYDENEKFPEDDICYIVARGGIYLKKTLDLVESITPVDKISFLKDLPTFGAINIPKFPPKMFGNIVGFFKEVYEKYKSEAVVLIYYNKDKQSFKIFAPEQEVSSASLSYETNHTIKDCILIGTVHSHGSMAAFHSGVDTSDEKNFDGLHITVGKVDKDIELFDICASVAINGMRIKVEPSDYIENLETREYTNYSQTMFRPGFIMIDGEKNYTNTVKTQQQYTITNIKDYLKFNPEWMTKVKEKVYPVHEYYHGVGGSHNSYIFKNGKLIEMNNKKNKKELSKYEQIAFGFNEYMQTRMQNDEKKCKNNPCETCIHKNHKLKMQEDDELSNLNEVDNLYGDFE